MLTGDRGLAEDLAQTALARAYASWPRIRPAVSYPPNAVTLVMAGPGITEAAGITGRAVAYIQLRLRKGKTARLHVLHIGGPGFYALSVLTGQVASWTAYTTTGHAIANGTGTPGSPRSAK